jgi:hypothetical protein
LNDRAVPRAPAQDGAVVAQPPLHEVGALLAVNRQRLAALEGDTRARARHEVLEAARRYLAGRGEPLPPAGPAALLMAGHQPELFHPGVWAKNFALAGLARAHSATALNLIVDNDTMKSTGLRLPAPPDDRVPYPHLATVLFDQRRGEPPWEERGVLDPELFAGFAERAGAVLRPWGYVPLLGPFWEEVQRQPGPTLGERFAGARRALERSWGCHNLELPLSAVCRTEAFARFACSLVLEAGRLREVYNAGVRAYRARHRVRSHNHPVPDLAAEDGWVELPLWGWRAGQQRRGRLFARLSPSRIELRAGADAWPALPRAGDLVGPWRELEGRGLKVRSRALTTTLFARLFVGDLFLHGIGGGKYDELTDELMRRFYGVGPPEIVMLSATRWLPLPAAPVGPADRRQLARNLRDLRYNPQRYLGPEAGLVELQRAKQALIDSAPADAAGRRERFRALRALNERLREPLAPREEEARRALEEIERQLAGNAVLRRRDYAFCLYPEEALRPFCARFLEPGLFPTLAP